MFSEKQVSYHFIILHFFKERIHFIDTFNVVCLWGGQRLEENNMTVEEGVNLI